MFEVVGKVQRVFLKRINGKIKYGFIEMGSIVEARMTVYYFNGVTVNGKHFKVHEDTSSTFQSVSLVDQKAN